MRGSPIEADWFNLRKEYQQTNVSCRQLAEKHGISFSALRSRAFKEGWRKLKKQISEKVQQNIIDDLTTTANSWVRDTILRGENYRKDIDSSKQQMDQKIDPTALDALSRTEVRITDMVRKAFGLPDSPQHVQVTGYIEVISPYPVLDIEHDKVKELSNESEENES